MRNAKELAIAEAYEDYLDNQGMLSMNGVEVLSDQGLCAEYYENEFADPNYQPAHEG